MTQDWQPIDSAPENEVVLTKIDGVQGPRNQRTLRRSGRLWWLPDGAMFIYYTPTHWMPLPDPPVSASPEEP
jgi:hypothetical protein